MRVRVRVRVRGRGSTCHGKRQMPMYMPSSILASGLLPSLQTPRRFLMYCCKVILVFFWIESLCASVLSMTRLKARICAVSTWSIAPGLHLQKWPAKASMMRSIFCASPGSLTSAITRRSDESSERPASGRLPGWG